MGYSAAQVEQVDLGCKVGPIRPAYQERFGVASLTRGKGIVAILALLVLATLAYAWIDGGREPLRDIAVPVAVPASAQ
jgi:hypothetical protein